jgi:rubrerythrin
VLDVSGSDRAEVEGSPQPAGDGDSRRRFLALAGPGALGLLLSACGSSSDPQTADPTAEKAFAPKGGQDKDIVNFALTLEYLEADFYAQVNEAGIFSGETATVLREIEANEREHVAALEALAKKLGGPRAEKPSTDFPMGPPAEVLKLAATLENTGAAAYLGQIDVIENRGVMEAAVSIHTVEARHAAKLNRLAGIPFTPQGPFASPLSMQEVLGAVSPYILG